MLCPALLDSVTFPAREEQLLKEPAILLEYSLFCWGQHNSLFCLCLLLSLRLCWSLSPRKVQGGMSPCAFLECFQQATALMWCKVPPRAKIRNYTPIWNVSLAKEVCVFVCGGTFLYKNKIKIYVKGKRGTFLIIVMHLRK